MLFPVVDPVRAFAILLVSTWLNGAVTDICLEASGVQYCLLPDLLVSEMPQTQVGESVQSRAPGPE